jgi:hypothetical protein
MRRVPRRGERRPGRPPAGQQGERVKDYPQVSVRLPRGVRDKLIALSQIRKQPQWRLIVDSVECYLRDLPDAERREVDDVIRSRGRSRRTRFPRPR